MSVAYFVGIDVGTGSARAALVTLTGEVVEQHVEAIKTWHTQENLYEQSSANIWQAICNCVRQVTSKIAKDQVAGIGFDATCSLVILGNEGQPLAVDPHSLEAERNIILWMDHRAHEEAHFINSTKHKLLDYVGGQVSLEMEMPKLLWLKRHHKATWSQMWRAFDLCDFLTWRSTDSDSRSLCSVVCKWNYDAMSMSWSKDFLQAIELPELCAQDYAIIGNNILTPGTPIKGGLSARAAAEFNLRPGIPVATGLIDAHAGALGMLGCCAEELNTNMAAKMAIIAGTSSCHMSLSTSPCWTKGIWGPYKNAILPAYYLNEAGQSTTGYLLDYIIQNHNQYAHLLTKISGKFSNVTLYLNNLLQELATNNELEDICYLTKELHIYPDFHGNRSPLADANLKGMITGLNMNNDEHTLALLYLACVQALAYQTRHIIENLNEQGGHNTFDMLLFCGGLAKNTLYVQCHADICQLPAVLPQQTEMVLIGAAMLGASASQTYASLEEASKAMGGTGKLVKPKASTYKYHARKYAVFKEMLKDQLKYRTLMQT